jgi:O-antigen/teichoic acid export membrane protein
MSPSSLGKTFARGVGWFYLLRLSSRAVSSLRTLVVARFLAPADFGVMGVALLVLSLLEMLATTGYSQAMIQKKEDIKEYLDTAWVVSVGRGALLGGLVYLCAPLAARFFQEPRAVSVLQVMALSPVLSGLSSPGLVALNKDLHFRKLVLFEAARSIVGAGVAIVSAILFRSVWALVAASLVGNGVFSLGSYLVHPYRPGLDFRWQQARELWGFGRWVLGNKLLHYLFNDGDDWVAGRLLGAGALGLYQTAYRLGCTPMTEITAVFSKVTFPTFSKLQDDVEKLRRAYLRILQVIMFASTPFALGMLLVARDGVELFLGEKWLPMVASVQILVLWGWIRSFRATTGPVLLAQGRPDLVTKFTAFKVVILAVLVVPASLRWGIVGTSWAVVTAAALEVPLLIRSLGTAVQTGPMQIVRRLARPLPAAMAMSGVVLFLQRLLSAQGIAVRLGASVVLGAATYLVLTLLLDRQLRWGLRRDVEEAVGHNVRPLLGMLGWSASRRTATTGN